MAEVVRFKISSTVAAFVRPGVLLEKKLAGIQAAPRLEPLERLTLLFCLLKDAESAVKEAAVAAFSSLPADVVLSYVQSHEAHPFLLDRLARVYHSQPAIVRALLAAEQLSLQAREFLQRQAPAAAPLIEVAPQAKPAGESAPEEMADAPDSGDMDPPSDAGDLPDEESAEINEEDEQYLSKFKIAMVMGIGEKIKMALTGDKEWRSILIKDSNKLVSGSVIKNPRITDGEILTILKVGVQNDEIVRLICANKEWIKNYMIRKALVMCPKTPLPNALRYLATLTEKDIAGFAKSKNISSVLSTQAKRITLSKKR